MPAVVKKFRDLDLNFNAHPITGDLVYLKDADAIKRSVRNLIRTGIYERFYQPNLGSGITQLLFEPINPLTQASIEQSIRATISRHEPRVSIIEILVNVAPDLNGYNVRLTFSVDNLSEFLEVDIFLERVR
jgi:phage baseplate assembly protein W